MRQLDVDNITLPKAPPCTPWCAGHRPRADDYPRDGWDDALPVAVVKWCRRDLADLPQVPQETDGPVSVWVERFADLRWHDEEGRPIDSIEVCTEPAHVRIGDWLEFTPEQAEALAAQMLEAAGLARL